MVLELDLEAIASPGAHRQWRSQLPLFKNEKLTVKWIEQTASFRRESPQQSTHSRAISGFASGLELTDYHTVINSNNSRHRI